LYSSKNKQWQGENVNSEMTFSKDECTRCGKSIAKFFCSFLAIHWNFEAKFYRHIYTYLQTYSVCRSSESANARSLKLMKVQWPSWWSLSSCK